MATYVCLRDCQEVLNGKIHFVLRGDTVESDSDLKESCFARIDTPEYKVDFITAGEAELLDAKWDFADAKAAVQSKFGVTLKKGPKEAVVAAIIDARFRNQD